MPQCRLVVWWLLSRPLTIHRGWRLAIKDANLCLHRCKTCVRRLEHAPTSREYLRVPVRPSSMVSWKVLGVGAFSGGTPTHVSIAEGLQTALKLLEYGSVEQLRESAKTRLSGWEAGLEVAADIASLAPRPSLSRGLLRRRTHCARSPGAGLWCSNSPGYDTGML